MGDIAILFAREDSIYKQIAGLDVYDKKRDARTYPGETPVIAHPPCRAWGRLRFFAKNVPPDEKALAIFAVEQVRKYGGVLEHPYGSLLWDACGLPKPGERDTYNGWTLSMPQFWFGHRADKLTLFYIVGCEPVNVPPIPLKLGEPTHVVQTRKRKDPRPHLQKKEREQTPLALAYWLIELARKCAPSLAANPNPTLTLTRSNS